MRISLAPMEGLVDAPLRAALTRIGGVDWCVTEFVRVTSTLLPPRYFKRVAPEWANHWHTPAGVLLKLQLLGSDPVCLADNAARAAELGAPGIDLNFGCPAKTVNRHRGGAVLLQEPDLLHAIVREVRRAVPASVPVTAKMRLGYENTDLALDCARALADGGAAELVVHARTKLDGYKPPAHWHWIALIKKAVSVPVVANGEIWTVEDFLQCRRESGCEDFMLGRGLVARPDLARQIRAAVAGQPADVVEWSNMLPIIGEFHQGLIGQGAPTYAPGRLKQWLGYLRRSYPEATALFREIRTQQQMNSLEPV
ncbi:tRNA dihydrouridine synthase [Chitinimonas sp. BJB300]|uniref:tRNA dihydrouridine synthase n=1 Tax=Chitinimonas sp. BJB300 TaxID=1559339 RepID=UPI000C0CCD92|nr:tRNA-dihydrouridine synthase family protein [Chitinimonas sp. BJB300]PHV11698.1 tRNA dihydrouridine(16) synthase DusC [Chitinimonas sp. BJB300]TSJ88599.1 tRNA-dihydrouridine synthase family protein [Chitinimonas sp. BJB300]